MFLNVQRCYAKTQWCQKYASAACKLSCIGHQGVCREYTKNVICGNLHNHRHIIAVIILLCHPVNMGETSVSKMPSVDFSAAANTCIRNYVIIIMHTWRLLGFIRQLSQIFCTWSSLKLDSPIALTKPASTSFSISCITTSCIHHEDLVRLKKSLYVSLVEVSCLRSYYQL